MRMWSPPMVLVLAMWSVAATACSASRPVPSSESSTAAPAAPDNFSIDMTIAVGRDRAADIRRQWAEGRSIPRSWKPARFVVRPDGTLHYAGDEGPAMWRTMRPGQFPPVRGVLTQRQMSDLWALVTSKGMGDPDQSAGSIYLNLVEIESDQVVHILAITAGNQRWCYVRPVQQESPADTTALANMLAELAWVDRRPPSQATVMPRRYDFGPDPYARYRTPAPTAESSSTDEGTGG